MYIPFNVLIVVIHCGGKTERKKKERDKGKKRRPRRRGGGGGVMLDYCCSQSREHTQSLLIPLLPKPLIPLYHDPLIWSSACSAYVQCFLFSVRHIHVHDCFISGVCATQTHMDCSWCIFQYVESIVASQKLNQHWCRWMHKHVISILWSELWRRVVFWYHHMP